MVLSVKSVASVPSRTRTTHTHHTHIPHAHTHKRTHARTHAHAHAHSHAHAGAHARTHARAPHTRTRTRTDTRTQARTHTCPHKPVEPSNGILDIRLPIGATDSAATVAGTHPRDLVPPHSIRGGIVASAAKGHNRKQDRRDACSRKNGTNMLEHDEIAIANVFLL
eukprot:GHVU01228787.1.p1 GENE.GHVU01228787.1~~GHVU01228787.1.p1  ORF type:complete len:166 (-),score=7.17 GHVU01228787.1:652-1149(-)